MVTKHELQPQQSSFSLLLQMLQLPQLEHRMAPHVHIPAVVNEWACQTLP